MNSKVKMKSRIVRLFKVGFNMKNSWNHKSQKTKLFICIAWHYCIANFRARKKNILHKHSQNKYSFIYTFLFLSFYFLTIRRFYFPENTNEDNIFKAMQYFKQRSLISVVNKNFDWLSKISPQLSGFSLRMKRLITAKEIFLSCSS